MTLGDVQRFKVSKRIVADAEQQLQQAGRDGYELFILWSGQIQHKVFTVLTSHTPEQVSYRVRGRELLVRVEGDALHRLNTWLYDAHQVLGIQVHSHPTEAFHSETDDSFAMVTTLGGLSIVVPEFARNGVLTGGTAIYRLMNDGWIKQASSIIEVR